MTSFTTTLLKKEQVADGTMAFHLQKPEGLEFIPGQHATFTIENPSYVDDQGNSRTFSFISIPSDTDIAFATRLRDSAFKRTLKEGSETLTIEVKNPRGSMVLPENTQRPLVFLAGGIGITPFMSMIKQATHMKSDQKISLFYANKTISSSAFLDELTQLQSTNEHFTFIPIMTREEDGSWQGEKGHITKEMIQKYLPQTENTIFYLAGPTAMVTSMTDVLSSLQIDPLFIKSEDYGEYK